MIKKGLYVIWDHLAQDFIGAIQSYAHQAVAVRYFTDAASVPESRIPRHPQDYALVRLGYINENGELLPDREVILEGTLWADTLQTDRRESLQTT